MAQPAQRFTRTTLRDFQQQLAHRLQEAQQAVDAPASAIAVSTIRGHWLFELMQVSEVLAPPEVACVPLTLSWYLGLMHHRGQFVGVIDLDGLLGAPVGEWLPGDRLLLLSPALPLRCAIRVARVHKLLDLSGLQPADPEPLAPSWARFRLAEADGRHCWTRVDAAAMLGDPAFLNIGQY